MQKNINTVCGQKSDFLKIWNAVTRLKTETTPDIFFYFCIKMRNIVLNILIRDMKDIAISTHLYSVPNILYINTVNIHSESNLYDNVSL